MFTSIYKKIKLVATNKFFIALAVVIAFASLTSGINLAKAVTSITNPIFLNRLSNVISTYPTTARLTVGGAVTQGGGIRATSTTGTVVPLLAADFDNENMIDVTLNVQDATLSFPATTTLGSNFLPTAGMMRTFFVRNATTTASMDLTLTGGTGMLLKKATSSAVIIGDTDGGNYAQFNLIRKANTDIEVLLVNIFHD